MDDQHDRAERLANVSTDLTALAHARARVRIDAADEAEVVHRRVFEADAPAPRVATAWVPFPCVRCGRFGASSPGRACAACWGLTR